MFCLWSLLFLAHPLPAGAEEPDTRLEHLINAWRQEAGMEPLQSDRRLYAAAMDVVGQGMFCPQDRLSVEVAIAEALDRHGYRDRYGYTLVLCGIYPTPHHVLDQIRIYGGPSRPELQDMGIVHLADLSFVRRGGGYVTDIWIVLTAVPLQ